MSVHEMVVGGGRLDAHENCGHAYESVIGTAASSPRGQYSNGQLLCCVSHLKVCHTPLKTNMSVCLEVMTFR
jgi:hypothetical protein